MTSSPARSRAVCAAAGLLFVAAATVALAQTTITITGVAYNTGYESDYGDLGYNLGQTYSFSFTIAPGIPQNDNGETAFSPYSVGYRSESAAEGDYFTALGGTGLLGTYVTPVDTNRFQDFGVGPNGGIPLMFITLKSNATGLGVTTPNGTLVTQLHFRVNDPNVSFDFPVDDDGEAFYVDPATYFATYFTAPGGTVVGGEANSYFQTNHSTNPVLWLTYLYEGVDEYSVDFRATSITITTSAIPEPSTYAALAGLGALGLVLWQRRRRAALAA